MTHCCNAKFRFFDSNKTVGENDTNCIGIVVPRNKAKKCSAK
jgi:hypothetical protein